MVLKGQLSIRNDTQTRFVSNQIARDFAGRGFSSASRIQTVLNDLKETADIKTLKELSESKLNEYIDDLREKVENEDIQAKTAQDYISALNMVIDYTNHIRGTELNHISAAQEGLSREIDYRDKSISQEIHNSFQNYLQEKFQETGDSKFERLNFAVEIQKEFGLRARESFGLSEKSINKALQTGKLHLGREDWTKNARERIIGINNQSQRETLEKLQNYLQEHNLKSLSGPKNNISDIKEFKSFSYNQATEYNKTSGNSFNFHAERHSWAQNQYSQAWQEKTGQAIQAPIKYYSQELEKAGWDNSGKFYDAVKDYQIKNFYSYVSSETGLSTSEIKEIDKEIRMEISQELGHNRLDITNTYLGHP